MVLYLAVVFDPGQPRACVKQTRQPSAAMKVQVRLGVRGLALSGGKGKPRNTPHYMPPLFQPHAASRPSMAIPSHMTNDWHAQPAQPAELQKGQVRARDAATRRTPQNSRTTSRNRGGRGLCGFTEVLRDRDIALKWLVRRFCGLCGLCGLMTRPRDARHT